MLGSIQFHMDCFSCVVCHKRLSDGVFFMRGEAALCEMHKSHIPTQLINSDRLSTDRLVHESRASANISTRKDSGEALCHSAAALIKTAKDVMMASGEFDKKVIITHYYSPVFLCSSFHWIGVRYSCKTAGDSEQASSQ